MQKAIMHKSNHFTVEIRTNEKTLAKELINVNKDCHCVT